MNGELEHFELLQRLELLEAEREKALYLLRAELNMSSTDSHANDLLWLIRHVTEKVVHFPDSHSDDDFDPPFITYPGYRDLLEEAASERKRRAFQS